MLSISPELLAAITNVGNDPAVKIVAELPTLNVAYVEQAINRVINFLRSTRGDLGAVEYILQLDFDDSASQNTLLTAQAVSQFTAISANAIVLSPDMHIVRSYRLHTTAPEVLASHSREQRSCLIHVMNSSDIMIYANGFIVKHLNLLSPFAPPAPIKRFSRHAVDYKMSLIEFYKQRVRFFQNSQHWDPPGDASKRVLCRQLGRQKTEMIFHKNLWGWLEENIVGAAVFGSVKKLSEDETDIELRIMGGGLIIIEVKWLGTNGKTPYGESRLRDGIVQIKNYLIREPSTNEACLVVFDGRDLDKFRLLEAKEEEQDQWKMVRHCLSEEVPTRGSCLVFFLESETASKRK